MKRDIEKKAIDRYPEVYASPERVVQAHSMAVAKEYRGSGLGFLIMQASLRYARDIGCEYMIAHIVAPETFTMRDKMKAKILGESKYF